MVSTNIDVRSEPQSGISGLVKLIFIDTMIMWALASYSESHSHPVIRDVFYFILFDSVLGLFLIKLHEFTKHPIFLVLIWILFSCVISRLMFPQIGSPMPTISTSKWRFTLPIFFTLFTTYSWYRAFRTEPFPGKGQHDPTSSATDRVYIPSDMDADALCGIYANRTTIEGDRVSEPYIGNWIKVNGSIYEIRDVGYPTGSILVALPTKAGKLIMLYFNKEVWGKRLEVLRRGNIITAIGKIQKIESINLVIGGSELLDVSPETQPASKPAATEPSARMDEKAASKRPDFVVTVPYRVTSLRISSKFPLAYYGQGLCGKIEWGCIVQFTNLKDSTIMIYSYDVKAKSAKGDWVDADTLARGLAMRGTYAWGNDPEELREVKFVTFDAAIQERHIGPNKPSEVGFSLGKNQRPSFNLQSETCKISL